MNPTLVSLAKNACKQFGIGITRYDLLMDLLERRRAGEDLALLRTLPDIPLASALQLLQDSRSQLRQDIFALSMLDFKRNGYFVEFGATNGVDRSNTYLLEKNFGWTGILAEPAKCWHEALRANRSCCRIDTDCVWKESNQVLRFDEVSDGELSTINRFSGGDRHRSARRDHQSYAVNTVSLTDLLGRHGAPREIDYLSIDTEGSEFEILNAFDFARYQISVITCEHAFAPKREKLFGLLTSNGYVRKHEELSQFDDWYVKADLLGVPGATQP